MSDSATPSKPWLRRFLLGLGPLALIAGIGWFLFGGGRYVSTDNAYVKADVLLVSAEVAGRAVEVPVRANATVRRGDLLLRIDPAPYRIAVAQVQAQLAAVENEIAAERAAYREKLEALRQARDDVAYHLREQARQLALGRENFVSQAQLDAAAQAVKAAQARARMLEQELARLAAALAGGPDVPLAEQPRYQAAKARLEQAELDLARTELRAPFDGVIGLDVPVVGGLIGIGRPLLSLVALGELWIEANFKETDLARVRPGQAATVRIDTFPDRPLRGHVEALSPASGAEFALLPPQNATGNWVKVVQRIPVRLRLAPHQELPPLRAGMSAEVRIDTESLTTRAD